MMGYYSTSIVCHMYITVDHAIQAILKMGPGTLLAKEDIKNAFHLLPVQSS